MAFLDTTPTSLVIEQLSSSDRRPSLDPSAAYRIVIEDYGYTIEIAPRRDEVTTGSA